MPSRLLDDFADFKEKPCPSHRDYDTGKPIGDKWGRYSAPCGKPLFPREDDELVCVERYGQKRFGRDWELLLYLPPYRSYEPYPNPRLCSVTNARALGAFDRLSVVDCPWVATPRYLLTAGPPGNERVAGIAYDAIGGMPLSTCLYYTAETGCSQPVLYPCRYNDIVRVALCVAKGLAALHNAGVVHDDLASCSVRVLRSGDAVLTNVRYQQIGPHLADETAFHTPADRYRAPEAISGDGDPLPSRDVYALGVLMLEMLTRRAPFVDRFPARHVTDMFYHVRRGFCQRVPDVYPRRLAELIYACVAPDPARRMHLGTVIETLDAIAGSEQEAPGKVHLGDLVPAQPADCKIEVVPWDDCVGCSAVAAVAAAAQ